MLRKKLKIRRKDEKERDAVRGGIVRALASGFERVYYVDTETDDYLEYASDGAFGEFRQERSGTRFFEECRETIPRLVHEDDRERVAAALEKETLLSVLGERRVFFLDYRLLVGGKPTYYRMKASRAEGPRIVIGVCDIDAQAAEEQRLEAEQARALRAAMELANRDALTGVKSKHAFDETEKDWDRRIAEKEESAFAVVFFDVNGLKEDNDSKGHAAGDQYLKSAAMVICNTFKHSPVFRIGGDEFAAILSGADYENRHKLMQSLRERSLDEIRKGGIAIAGGLAEHLPGSGESFAAVFKRADAAMYENKKELKDLG